MDFWIIVFLLGLALLGAPLFAIFGAAAMLLFSGMPDTPITGATNDVFSEKFANSPLLVTIDHEGGRVQRFRKHFFELPPFRTLGRLYEEDRDLALKTAGAMGWLMAAELRAIGIDMSFTPWLSMG